MTKNEFIKIKKSGKKAIFKNLIGLKRDENNTSFLIDFMHFSHAEDRTIKEARGCEGKASNPITNIQYAYTLFKGAILQVNLRSGNRIIYNIN
jgi:hypothetical protein